MTFIAYNNKNEETKVNLFSWNSLLIYSLLRNWINYFVLFLKSSFTEGQFDLDMARANWLSSWRIYQSLNIWEQGDFVRRFKIMSHPSDWDVICNLQFHQLCDRYECEYNITSKTKMWEDRNRSYIGREYVSYIFANLVRIRFKMNMLWASTT